MNNFTHDYYKYFLETLAAKYKFITFKKGKELFTSGEPAYGHVIMRHDIDLDLQPAAEMAKIEQDFGINSTYFIQIRCPLYNPFDNNSMEYIQQIIYCGHQMGLHFDCAIYPDNQKEELNSLIEREIALFKSFYRQPLIAVSFHRPGAFELNDIKLNNYPNTYENIFLDYFSYFSDSRSIWAKGNPLDSKEFNEGHNLHLCIHPVWWSKNAGTPFSKLENVVVKANRKAEEYLSANCSVWHEGIAHNVRGRA